MNKAMVKEESLLGPEIYTKGRSYYRCIHELFEEQVVKVPGSLAVVFKKEQLTFRQLNERANQVAHFLKSKGVKQEVTVPICVERSIEMIVWILGILKAGGAYVPIDPRSPEHRISYVINNTGAFLVIVNRKDRAKIRPDQNVDIVEVENEAVLVEGMAVNNPGRIVEPGNLAYIIYTSGSTGTPKGVMIEHASLSNYLLRSAEKYTGGSVANAGSFVYMSFAFDASLTAMFLPLILGKFIVISANENIEVFEDANFRKYAPYDFIKATPAHLELLSATLQEANKTWITNKLVVGGEVLYIAHLTSYIAKGVNLEVFNEYGPTEASVGCTTFRFNTGDNLENLEQGVPIGKPMDNVQIYILDDAGKLVLPGVVGQIFIGGAGLARGYVNLPERTSEKFIENCFDPHTSNRLYMTGDYGKWLPDGNIEYTGRKDDQVKIGGHRVELVEVETAVNNRKHVNSSCVLVRQGEDQIKTMVCFYVPDLPTVKEKAKELFPMQVALWHDVYESEYEEAEMVKVADEEFNLAGWTDSFKGGAIPAEQMQEWRDDIVSVILSGRPKNVLEIGCGTGLIYFQLAGKVARYIGTDFSKSSISQIQKKIEKANRYYGDTNLKVAAAHEVAIDKKEEVDTIILNSIVQYFPGEEYLSDVIDKSISCIAGEARIIIGDVRDNRLLTSFHLRKHVEKFDEAEPIKNFYWRIQEEVKREKELCLSPDYFYNLRSKYPDITHIDIQWKQGQYINELTLFRYTVVIYVNVEKKLVKPDWKAWDKRSKDDILLGLNEESSMAIKDVPNPRLAKEIRLQKTFIDKSVSSVSQLKKIAADECEECKEVIEIISRAKQKGLDCRFLLNNDPLKINLIIQPHTCSDFIEQLYTATSNSLKNTNIPLLTDVCSLIEKELKLELLSVLPKYMVPGSFYPLPFMPLTENGKIDRSFLNYIDVKKSARTYHLKRPGSLEEEKLAEIWMELLHIKEVSVDDDFFEKGGNSILAFRMFSKIRKTFGKNLPLGVLLKSSTIEKLARVLIADEDFTTWTSLVPIQRYGSKLPLFCVHGGWGHVLFYRDLAKHLGDDQPLYGLQVKGLNGQDKPFYKLEEMAAHYIEEIQTVQPEGPYNLGGFCYGAIVAFEMAQQLLKQGQEVALLVNFNGVSPLYLYPHNFKNDKNTIAATTEGSLTTAGKVTLPDNSPVKKKRLNFYRRTGAITRLKKKLKKWPSRWKKRIVSLAYRAAFTLYERYAKPMPEQVLKHYILQAMGKSQSTYIPKPYPGKMVIFRSPKLYRDPHLGWSRFVAGGIETIDVTSEHTKRIDILHEPHVEFVSQELQKHLLKIRAD